MLVQGIVADFPESEPLALLLQHHKLQRDSKVEFLSGVEFQGVSMRRQTGVLVDGSLYRVERLLACQGQFFVWLRLLTASLAVDSFGQRVAIIVNCSAEVRGCRQ